MPRQKVRLRDISVQTRSMLWGRAAGRCEFNGCNKPLWESSVTRESANIAQAAHIWAFSPDGPRGNEGVSTDALNSADNLMLMCHQCHTLIDQDKDGSTYSVARLMAMKADHEERVELVTSITPDMQSTVLLYGANIGEQSSPLSYQKAAPCLFPHRYPKDRYPIELGLGQSPITDADPDYWSHEQKVLRESFNTQVRTRLAAGNVEHLSVFAIAPQPLLFQLGALLSDIPSADVYQLHREPATWAWLPSDRPTEFHIQPPENHFDQIAVVFSLSGTVAHNRVHRVLGDKVSIWTVTIENPRSGCISEAGDLRRFRETTRSLFDQLHQRHPEARVVHVFPAMPVSAAVEVGRVRMPKADPVLRLYDHIGQDQGFVHAFDI